MPKVKENTFFQAAISGELGDSGCKIEDFCENNVSLFSSKSLPPGVQEKMKKLGGRSAPPG